MLRMFICTSFKTNTPITPAMASKGAKETIANKLGFKSSGSKSMDTELEKVRKENAQLKKTLDEMSMRNGKLVFTRCDSENARLLEQLMAKKQEVVKLREQLRPEGGEVVASLQNQLEQKRKEAEQKDKEFQALSQESKELRNKLVTATQRSKAIEKHSAELQVCSGEIAVVQEQLRDALEKNQHWLVYDQQREAYVQGILARMTELEQQLNLAKHALQQPYKEANSEDQPLPSVGHNREQMLQMVQKKLENQQAHAGQLQAELEGLRVSCEDRKQEVAQLQEHLQQEQRSSRQVLAEERKVSNELMARLQNELVVGNGRLEEERKKSAELLLQVNLLQKSLLKQHEEQQRIAVLERQIQMTARDFENEKLDRQSLQQQLYKVLKELRKARDQITTLVSAKPQREGCFSEVTYNRLDTQDHILTTTSPAKSHNALDESFLECPNCRTSYPTSQHRELLRHLDYCFN